MGGFKIIPNYTYEDYKRWKGRWEIIDGIAYDMSPMAPPEHQRIANELGRLLSETVENSNCKCQVYQPIDVKIDENNVVNPDLLIVCKPIIGQYLDTPPELVVEILSPSTRLKDTISKYQMYEKFGIKYYLIIDPKEKKSTAYFLHEGKYEELIEWKFDLGEGCTFNLDISKVTTF